MKKNFKIENIIVIGNICSGKTVFIDRINNHFNFNVVSIDGLRVNYGDGSFSKEYFCWTKLLESIEKESGTIIEITGAGTHKYAIKQAITLTNKNWLVIYLQCPLPEIKKRIKSKNFDTPYPWNVLPEKIVDKIQIELEEDFQNKFWELKNTSILSLLTEDTAMSDINEFLRLLN